MVRFETTLGDFELTLFPAAAPGHVENFLTYVTEGFYDGTLVHRVVPGFVIQGGGYTPGPVPKPATHPPIPSEADNGLSNVRGTLSLALVGQDADSGTSQWFINLDDNTFLDYPADPPPSFTVFGEVSRGMAVVDAIGAVATGSRGGLSDTPLEEVVVQRAEVVR
ncbi:MAG: peptidyl-prolyl cis-trans isomerase [Nitrospirae bacterium]|nr:MAG: peptidyl-prolyl cis-trans isomerase [Nitrospirota bacterium]